ncbi:MAG: aldehyde dehydrogenase family protein, partial [bacterium]|nr:aldehyde dehydrogenase family protein [bacterium]
METYRNYIDGEWTGGETSENRNPANTDDLVGNFVKGTPEDVTRAAERAEAALPGWAGMSGPGRGNYLFKVADILDSRFEQIAMEMTREEGKTLPEAKGET